MYCGCRQGWAPDTYYLSRLGLYEGGGAGYSLSWMFVQRIPCMRVRDARPWNRQGRPVNVGEMLECGDIGGRRRRSMHVPPSAATIDASFTHFPSSTASCRNHVHAPSSPPNPSHTSPTIPSTPPRIRDVQNRTHHPQQWPTPSSSKKPSA
jgi:hypothetical protein